MDTKDKIEDLLRQFSYGISTIPDDMPIDKRSVCFDQLLDTYSNEILELFS